MNRMKTAMVLATMLMSTLALAKVEVNRDVEIFSEKTKEPQAVTVSPDGKTLYWIAKKSENTKLEAIDVWFSDTTDIKETSVGYCYNIQKGCLPDLLCSGYFSRQTKIIVA